MTPERDSTGFGPFAVLLFVGSGCLLAALSLVGVIWVVAAALRWAFS